MPEFNTRSIHTGFVVDEVAVGQVFPEYFDFPLSVSFHNCFNLYFIHLLQMLYNLNNWHVVKQNTSLCPTS
jgi:hypothetical protein